MSNNTSALSLKKKKRKTKTSTLAWKIDNIRKGKVISAPIQATKYFFEVSALPDRHCPKLQSCAISRKTKDATLRNGKNPDFGPNLDP